MADTIQPTSRNKLLGLLSDMLGGAYGYTQRPDPTMPMGLANPVLGLLGNALPLKAGANVLDDLSYGRAPVRGTGMTTRLTPDATELAMAAAPFPKTSGKAALAALGAVDTGASGLGKAAIVWHGSPHRFNAFDASKIGTGEGAQAYGHGLYLAESPGVAESYAKVLPSRVDTPEWYAGKALPQALDRAEFDELGQLARDMMKMGSLPAQKMQRWRELNDRKQVFDAAVDEARPKSNLYKVDLPDNMIARMLDWDRPLSQQPEVVNNALKVFSDLQGFENYIPRGERAPVLVGRGISGDTRGRDLYRFLGQDTDSKDAASTLRGLGVPGIRYLDGGSRGVGAGTSNFVVFPGEENALTILERNGRGLLD